MVRVSFGRFLWAGFLGALLITPIWADTVTLKNGTVVSGRITGQDRTHIFMQTSAGRRVIAKATLRRIQYEDPAESERVEREKRERERAAREKAASENREAEKAKREKAERAKRERQDTERKRLEQEQAERQRLERERRAREADLEAQRNPRSLRRRLTRARLALVPGLAHWAEGERTQGIAIGTTTAVLLLLGIREQGVALSRRDAYEAQAEQRFLMPLFVGAEARVGALGLMLTWNNDDLAAYRQRVARRNSLLALAGTVYLVQLGHAALALGTGTSATGDTTWYLNLAFRF